MRIRGFGRIIAVLSSGVREPLPELAYSNSGRSALASWLKTVGRAVAVDGVTVNGVVPGRIDTPRVASLDEAAAKREGIDAAEVRRRSVASIPAGRYGRPDEFASVVGFLASESAGYVTASLLSCDGGMMRSLT
jgi:3-oxoacyl-[acyl-carrier protein] reductase